jgi:hypothetical protein
VYAMFGLARLHLRFVFSASDCRHKRI